MREVALLTILTVLVVVLSNADGGFDRRVTGLCIAAVTSTFVASVLDVPRETLRIVAAAAFVVIVLVAVLVFADRVRRLASSLT